MSIRHKSETPRSNYGPATGVPSPDPYNEALSTGKDHKYTGDVTPGTSKIIQPGYVPDGPGHADCNRK